jgi:DNA-binding CsgD family transcriptional regulator
VPGQRSRSFLSDEEWLILFESLRLSPREAQVAQAIFDDESEVAIADALALSTHTVHSYLERLYRKLQVNSRCGLVVRIFAEYVALRSAGDGAARTAVAPPLASAVRREASADRTRRV